MAESSSKIRGSGASGPGGGDAGSVTGDRLRRWGLGTGKMTPEERRTTLEQLYIAPRGPEFRLYLLRFVVLLLASVLIAWCGMRADSTAVVIGAMLVAPLMEPILGIAGALVMNWRIRLLRSSLVLLMGGLITVAMAALLDLVIPHSLILPRELLARTHPTLLDLGVALGAGIAAGYAVAKRISAAAPGVAVAVALVPPLVATGILLAEQRHGLALNALLLFGTNLAAILLAVSVILLLSGFAPERAREKAGVSLIASLATTSLAVIAMSVPLAFYTDALIQRNTIRDAVIDSVNHWSRFSPQEIFNVRLQDELIIIDIAGDIRPRSTRSLAEEIASRVGHDVELRVQWIQSESNEVHGRFRGERRELSRVLPRSFEYLH